MNVFGVIDKIQKKSQFVLKNIGMKNKINKLVLIILFINIIPSSVEGKPVWWGNDIGRDDILLPGYDPIQRTQKGIRIGKRYYDFTGTGYVNNVVVDGYELVSGIFIELIVDGKVLKEISKNQLIKSSSNTRFIIQKEIQLERNIKIIITSLIEYDGVAMIDVKVIPSAEIKVDALNLISNIKFNKNTVVLAYKADNIRKQKKRDDILKLPYKGKFLNVISISNGDNSFWWFADNAKGWIWNDKSVTIVSKDKNNIQIKQKVIGSQYVLRKNLRFKFNFLVTPIKRIDASFRAKRIMWGVPSKRQLTLKSSYKLWWPNAFAYDAFPYTEYPRGTKSLLDYKDIKSYKSREENKKLISRDRKKWGVSWIPYFSAHVISELDPTLLNYKKIWEIKPRKVFKDGLNPYSNKFNKPVLTHRAEGYTDYILWRISEEIDNIGMDGIYLDHGPPHDSNSMFNGGWYDSNGKLQPSLDILALRAFLKRLKILFYTKNKPGYIFVHNSNREIIPAYGFVFGTIDGEQYRNVVVEGNYLDVISIDEFRARFSNKQYGVIDYWLLQEWANNIDNKSWIGSYSQKQSYRKAMALALLHDVPVWPQGAHLKEQRRLMRILDEFKIEKSEFIGYWENKSYLTSANKNILISEYRSSEKSLFIIANIRKKKINMAIPYDELTPIFVEKEGKFDLDKKEIIFNILPYDFLLVVMKK